MAYQFICFSQRVYTICLWPAAYDEENLAKTDKIIRSCAEVVHRKEILMTEPAVEQLMISFYKSMSWTGCVENGFKGVAAKARDCCKGNAPTTVYVIGGIELEQVVALKQHIRDLYAIDNSSVHITDTHEEAIEAGKLLLFQNSIDFMNARDPFRDPAFLEDFAPKASSMRDYANPDSTLALYGLAGHRLRKRAGDSFDRQDPKDYFFFWGVKMPSLDYVKAAKTTNREDLRLIETWERRRQSGLAAALQRIGGLSRMTAERIFRFFIDLRARAKRTTKVCYHRIKYRNQRVGTGKMDVKDLRAVFLKINTTTADYLVMRNWEGFFDDILLEGHNDIDLLCRDRDSRDIIVRLLDARPLTADGFHYCFLYQGRKITLDTRILGDGYYDRRWQREMLARKRQHPLGFYIMDPENYYYSLIYHAIYQKKGGLSEEYEQRLSRMSPLEETHTQDGYAERLDAYMRKKHFAYTRTADQSVFLCVDNTPFRKKLSYPSSVRLYHLLQRVKNNCLLQRIKIKLRNMIVRG